MKVLGIDTSTQVGGASLLEGDSLVGEYVLNVQATHSERLLPAIDRILCDAGWTGKDLDLIAVVTGPGSFTGLRIGVTTAKALAYVWETSLVGVTSFEALAYQAGETADFVYALVSARRRDVYAALYEGRTHLDTIQRRLFEPKAVSIDALLGPSGHAPTEGKITCLGDAVPLFHAEFRSAFGERYVEPAPQDVLLRSASVASSGLLKYKIRGGVDPYALVPYYLKKSEAERQWEKKELSK